MAITPERYRLSLKETDITPLFLVLTFYLGKLFKDATECIYKKMRLNNNNLALIILAFIFFSISSNIFIWFYTTGSFPTGKAISGQISVCIDIPPNIYNTQNKSTNTTLPFTYQLTAIDSGNPIHFYANITNLSAANLSSFAMNLSGFINFTTNKSEIGNYTITAWVTHDFCPHAIDWEQFNLQVVLYNRPPSWVNITSTTFTGTEDQLLSANLSMNATDLDGDNITFGKNKTLANFPHFDITASGFINFTPTDADVCAHVVNITLNDTNSMMNSKDFTFDIANVNDAPVMSVIPDQQLCEDTYYYYQVSASDDDVSYVQCNSQQLHFYDDTPLFVINEGTGEISLIPRESNKGAYLARIYATDGFLVDYKDANFLIIEVNDAPVLSAIGAKTIRANSTLYINASATDEEGGISPNANFTFNVTFLNGTRFFDINATTGIINTTTNDSLNGTYSVQICTNDTGLTNPHANATFVCGDGKPKSSCEIVSVTVTTINYPPNITSYLPLTNRTINETNNLDFSITAEDPEGGNLTVYWYKNGNAAHYNVYNYTLTTVQGDSGVHNISVNVSDGEYNSSVSWIITVNTLPVPVVPPSVSGGGGGGGGGALCDEVWTCTDWSFCQNATATDSQDLLKGLFKRVISECKNQSISTGNCGFQIRGCNQVTDCVIVYKRPAELQTCIFTTAPTCYDNIKNCHDNSCEILTDCGGPCKECPTCSDGIKNQGEDWIDCGGPCKPCPMEYPKPPKCGDKKCEISELFGCRTDCGFFWFIVMLSIILIVIITLLSRIEIRSARLQSLNTERAKRKKYLGNLIGMMRNSIADKNIKVAKHLYLQIKTAYEHMPRDEKKAMYPRLLKLYAEIEKLGE